MIKRKRKFNSTKKINPILILGSLLIVFLLSLSVGFSALSTSLTVNGRAAFIPVGMIRIMSFKPATHFNAEELSRTFTHESVSVTGTLTNYDSRLVYDMKISNLGQVDKVLDRIIEEVFSNSECEYELSGLSIGDVIEARSDVEFQLIIKYKSGVTIPIETGINAKLKFVFEDYNGFGDKAYFIPYNGENNLFGLNKSNITSFSRNTTLTKEQVLAKSGVTLISNVSNDQYNSNEEIYGWIENNNFYWWSEAQIVYFHPETTKAFKDFANIVTIDLNGTSTEKVENFAHWFDKCRNLTTINGTINTSGLKLVVNPNFNYATDTNNDSSSGYGLTYMFNDCNKLTGVDLSEFNTTNASDMKRMFAGCKKITEYDLSGFDTSNVRSMYWMFRTNESVTNFDISNFDTSNVENTFGMFVNSKNVKTVKLGNNFDTSKVRNMGNMFYGMTNLTTIYAKIDFIRGANLTSSSMFYNDTKLVGAKDSSYETVFNSGKTNSQYAQIASPSQPGYFTLYGDVIPTYTITYDLNGGVASNPSTYREDSETFTLNQPVKPGCIFVGWTGSNGTTPQLSVTIPQGTTGNLNYVANYVTNYYMVIFNPNGGSGTMDDEHFDYGEYKSLSPNLFTHTTKSFINWNTSIDGTGTSITDQAVVGNLMEVGNYNIYAQWYDPNGSSQLVFNVPGPCGFNGNSGNITGSNCKEYSGTNTIDTKIPLFSHENIDTDFMVSFDISYSASNQDAGQSTIFNTFPETSSTENPGIVIRKVNNSSIEILARDSSGKATKTINTSTLQSLSIIRKNRKVCYKVNDGNYKFLYDFVNMNVEFDKPLSIGSSINGSGNVWRTINGTISNIEVYLGTLGNDIDCNESMH